MTDLYPINRDWQPGLAGDLALAHGESRVHSEAEALLADRMDREENAIEAAARASADPVATERRAHPMGRMMTDAQIREALHGSQ